MIALYFIIWWVMLFTVLPFGVRTQSEAGEIIPGTPGSAPVEFRLLRVVVITTIVSAIVFALLWAVLRWGLIDIEKLMSLETTPKR